GRGGMLHRFELWTERAIGQTGDASDAGDRRVDAVEDALLCSGGLWQGAVRQPLAGKERPVRLDLARLLALVLAAAFRRDLDIRAAEQRIEHAGWHPHRRLVCRVLPEALADIELLRLPRTQALSELLGESRGIAGRPERERGELADELMLAVTVG